MTKTSNSKGASGNCNEQEFDLLCNYGVVVASRSIVVENDERDKYRYSLYKVLEPFPTFDEYVRGEEFDEGELIVNCRTMDEILFAQNKYKIQVNSPILV